MRQKTKIMESIHLLLILVVTVASLGQTVRAQDDTPADHEKGANEGEAACPCARPANDAPVDQEADEAGLAVAEAHVSEVAQFMGEDEATVVADPPVDEKIVINDEVEVNHDQEIFAVQLEDVEEMLEDIKDDQLDVDADVIEKKLNDVKFEKDHDSKSDVERRKLELAEKKKRNEIRKKKHDERAKKHEERHKTVDKWADEMKVKHRNGKTKRQLSQQLIKLAAQHAAIHGRLFGSSK